MGDEPRLTGLSPLSLLINAPLAGHVPGERTLHAVDMAGIRTNDVEWTARCGTTVAPSLVDAAVAAGTDAGDQVRIPLRWPPRVRSLADDVTVCAVCRRRSERPRDTTPFRGIEITAGGTDG